jgi:hypothetical protein
MQLFVTYFAGVVFDDGAVGINRFVLLTVGTEYAKQAAYTHQSR